MNFPGTVREVFLFKAKNISLILRVGKMIAHCITYVLKKNSPNKISVLMTKDIYITFKKNRTKPACQTL